MNRKTPGQGCGFPGAKTQKAIPATGIFKEDVNLQVMFWNFDL